MKLKFKPNKKVTREFKLWYAWRPVRVSENQLAWFENVYRREEAFYRRDKTKYTTKYMSKEDYFTQSMRNADKLKAYSGREDKEDSDSNAGMSIQSSNKTR